MTSKGRITGGIAGGIAGFFRSTLAPFVAARLPSMLRFLVNHRRDVVGGPARAQVIAELARALAEL